MKRIILVLIFFGMLITGCANQKACDIYNLNLKTIKDRVDKKPGQNVVPANDSILFFERITGIVSESDGNFEGRYNPTLNDYIRWVDWFKMNHKRLYWDKKEKQVRVK